MNPIGKTDICTTPTHVLLFFNQGAVQCGYSINFPVQLTAGGTTFDINVFDDYFPVYNGYPLDQIDMVFPFSITLLDGGTAETYNSDAAFCAFIDQCE